VVWFRCRDRQCPLCQRARARQAAERVRAAIRDADALRFITLTIRSSSRPLAEQLDELVSTFRSFRRSKAWRAHVKGGIATLEVTRNPDTGQWHPHLHMLVDGVYWHQPELSRAWLEYAPDSPVVDIQAVNSRGEAGRYIAKYTVKGDDESEWPLESLAEYAMAMSGRRAVMTFGTLHNVPSDRDEEPARQAVDRCRLPISQLEQRSRAGCRDARIVITGLVETSMPYARSLEVRPAGAMPLPLEDRELAILEAPAAMARLERHWLESPLTFATNRPKPEPPPVAHEFPCGRISTEHTPPLGEGWLDPPRRHW
jgi:hypothetical protein